MVPSEITIKLIENNEVKLLEPDYIITNKDLFLAMADPSDLKEVMDEVEFFSEVKRGLLICDEIIFESIEEICPQNNNSLNIQKNLNNGSINIDVILNLTI